MKYWICKRATPHAAEALECLGGNGYVEESPMPQLLRDSPLNGIWEGSGNVISLDVLRAMAREPEGLPAFLAECELARGGDRRLDAHLDALPATLGRAGGRGRRSGSPAARSRTWRSRSRARCWCGTRRPAVADAFCAGRLGDGARPRVRHAAARGRRRRDRRARARRVKLFTRREAARRASVLAS